MGAPIVAATEAAGIIAAKRRPKPIIVGLCAGKDISGLPTSCALAAGGISSLPRPTLKRSRSAVTLPSERQTLFRSNSGSTLLSKEDFKGNEGRTCAMSPATGKSLLRRGNTTGFALNPSTFTLSFEFPSRFQTPTSTKHSPRSALTSPANSALKKEDHCIAQALRRRVNFCPARLNSSHDVTPYAKKYGKHPKFFEFNRRGEMELNDRGVEEELKGSFGFEHGPCFEALKDC